MKVNIMKAQVHFSKLKLLKKVIEEVIGINLSDPGFGKNEKV